MFITAMAHRIFFARMIQYTFSTHQFHGIQEQEREETGSGNGRDTKPPPPAGAGHSEIVENAFADDLVHRMNRFKPELVIISAGFDSRINDPLGDFKLEDDHFAELTKVMRTIADEHSDGRVLSVLEGGYNLKGLASACVSHLQALVA